MLTREQHLLILIAEECAEVAQRATKALRFGLHEQRPGAAGNNLELLHAEMTDLITVYRELTSEPFTDVAIETKRARMNRYIEYSRGLGILE